LIRKRGLSLHHTLRGGQPEATSQPSAVDILHLILDDARPISWILNAQLCSDFEPDFSTCNSDPRSATTTFKSRMSDFSTCISALPLLHSLTRAAASGEKIRQSFQPSAAASDYSTSRLSTRCGGDERAGQWLRENGSVMRRKLVGVGAMDGAAAGLLRKCSICNEYGHRADNRRNHPLPLHVPAAHCAMWLRNTGIREQKSLQD
jgi:hypothetical protein